TDAPGGKMREVAVAGHRVDAAVVSGPSFWNSVEIEEAPALLPATVAAAERLLS
ncbi:MAG: hypothetical protein HC937_03030, partial [Aquincola sp.]|nr:hypothetical protein [Aquincola sp.]